MLEHDTEAVGAAVPGHYGAAGTGLTLEPATVAAAWNVHARLERGAIAEKVEQLFGVALPRVPNTYVRTEALCALWLGPESWLLIAGGESPLSAFEEKRDALNAQGGALFDWSASRCAWRIAGVRAATVLNKGCPLDFDPRAFPANGCAQSVLGHVNALFRRDHESSFTVMVARSYARDAWGFLCSSAASYGYDVLPATSMR